MKKLNTNKTPLVIKTGTVDEFFNDLHEIAHALDTKKNIKPVRKLIFQDPLELLQFLTEAKIKLINRIRKHPDSITNIAKAVHRNRVAVQRDVSEMEKFGLVKISEEINPGHGKHKIVELVASTLKLEAYI
jgi:predicted transcriptional regulator